MNNETLANHPGINDIAIKRS